MSKNKSQNKRGYPSPQSDTGEWGDEASRKAAQSKRLAQKHSYTRENKELIERLIHRVRMI